MNKIKTFKEACLISRKAQSKGKKIVFCHGIFDILHRGHVHLLVKAKNLGDILIVGVDCDDNAKTLKGKNRPINNLDSRMFVLQNLVPVDYIFEIPKYPNKDIHSFMDEIYLKLKPDIAATSVTPGRHGELKRESARVSNAKFVDISDYIHDNNTTKVVKLLNL